MPPKAIIDPQAPAAAPKVSVWDVPTRLFHWLLAGLIGLSWWSAEEHKLDLHLYSGAAILTLLIFRLLWGIVGSSTARFANFVQGPRAILGYLRGDWRGVGHSPLAALSIIALLAATAIQLLLGLFSSDEDGLLLGPLSDFVDPATSETVAELHEDFFNVLLGLIILHVAAILFYWIVRKRDLVMPMITGRAALNTPATPMRRGKWWVAALCLVVALAITRWILAGAPPFGP